MEEALIFQNDKHHKEKVKLTEAQIKQADNNNPNPNLEVIITQADKNTKTLVNTIKEANKPVEKPSNQEVV